MLLWTLCGPDKGRAVWLHLTVSNKVPSYLWAKYQARYSRSRKKRWQVATVHKCHLFSLFYLSKGFKLYNSKRGSAFLWRECAVKVSRLFHTSVMLPVSHTSWFFFFLPLYAQYSGKLWYPCISTTFLLSQAVALTLHHCAKSWHCA